jgi:putative peptidoglycan lipid II flippase
LNIVLGTIFYLYTDLGASGMALSYSIISLVNSIILLFLLHKKMKGIHAEKLLSFLIRALPSSAVMGAALLLIQAVIPNPAGKSLQLLYLILEIITGSIIYIIIMLLLKSQDAIYLMKKLKQRMKM